MTFQNNNFEVNSPLCAFLLFNRLKFSVTSLMHRATATANVIPETFASFCFFGKSNAQLAKINCIFCEH